MSNQNKDTEEKIEEVKDAVTDKAEEIKDAAADKAEEIKDAAADKAEEVKDAVTDKAEEIKDAAEEKAESYKGILGDYKEETEAAPAAEAPKPEDPAPKKNGGKKVLAGVGIAAGIAAIGGLTFMGINLMRANQPKPALSTEHFVVTQEMLTCYYHDMIDLYTDYYGADGLLNYYQLDVSKPLKDQPYPGAEDGSTWFDYMMDDTISTIKQQLYYAEAGKEEGFELPEEDKQAVEDALAERNPADYGEGITMDDLRQELELQAYSSAYYRYHFDTLTFTDDEINAYYDANSQSFQTCGLATFVINYEAEESSEEESSEEESSEEESSVEESSVEESAEEESSVEESSEEESSVEESAEAEAAEEESAEEESSEEESSEAESSEADSSEEESSVEESSEETPEEDDTITREKADALAKELQDCKDLDTFKGKAREILINNQGYTAEDADNYLSTMVYDDYGYSDATELMQWVFSGEAKLYDTYVIEAADAFYVYMVTKEPGRDETNVIDVRHILFALSNHGGDDLDNTEPARTECMNLAKDCLAEWEAGDRTEDSFAALATEKTEDPGSQSTGGLYESVSVGQMVQPFNDWCFDPARQPGDTGIVETDYGAHVMYFVKTGEPHWKSDVINYLKQEHYTTWNTELEAKYPVTQDDELINSIEG